MKRPLAFRITDNWRSWWRIGLWAEGSLIRSSSGASSVVALSKSHFHSSICIYAYALLYPSPKIAPMELAQLCNKSQKISCSFQFLSSLSVNCENNKSNSLQMSDIRFLQVSVFSSFLLDHFVLEMSYFLPVGTNIYGYSQLWVFKICEHFCYVLIHFILFFLNFWAVKICGLQICWNSKYVGIQKCG